MTTIIFVRHGEVHNPKNLLYSRLPGFRLSRAGRYQIGELGRRLAHREVAAIYSSPLERARESATIIREALAAAGRPVAIANDELLLETEIDQHLQGGPITDLQRPYITEEGVKGIESAVSLRGRMMRFAAIVMQRHGGQCVVTVSHRDPIVVALLHWLGQDVGELPGFDLPTGGAWEVRFLNDSQPALVSRF